MTDLNDDVFWCHNSKDKPAVIELSKKLEAWGVGSWVDYSDLQPGLTWMDKIEGKISKGQAVVVCIGKNNIGPVQNEEIGYILIELEKRNLKKKKFPIIPVILKDAPESLEIPDQLKKFTYVDFRPNMPRYSDPMVRLFWGIKSYQPELYEYYDDDKGKKLKCALVHLRDNIWKEQKNDPNKEFNGKILYEIKRDSDFIIIYDEVNHMKIKIPIEGGWFLMTWYNDNIKAYWRDLPYRECKKISKTDTD